VTSEKPRLLIPDQLFAQTLKIMRLPTKLLSSRRAAAALNSRIFGETFSRGVTGDKHQAVLQQSGKIQP
jgi:hypothetical protein